ncbi:Panacea domain-containing protein [Halomonas salina]|uniref:Panacea domain-containing protein n=1 Tax=Halomonas salina TaxID=42565 RepID=UPI0009DD8610|nr:type II toxin-antitoxin system antitoxin SocA domain-containing protein [Halomonas salina]
MRYPTSAAAVANFFLDVQERGGFRFPEVDLMKLMGLVYYSHAWWLAYKGEPLFEDNVEAWSWGPAVSDIYYQFQDFGCGRIVGRSAVVFANFGSDDIAYKRVKPPSVPQSVEGFLMKLWESHRYASGVQLLNATHLDGEPWAIVKDQYEKLEHKPRIPNELIRRVFALKLEGDKDLGDAKAEAFEKHVSSDDFVELEISGPEMMVIEEKKREEEIEEISRKLQEFVMEVKGGRRSKGLVRPGSGNHERKV